MSRLSPSNWVDPISIVAGGTVIFLAYEGFELIANTGKDVESPSVLPRAFYAAVTLVVIVYVLVAIVAVGTLPYDEIISARDYALASTSSAINATLYGTARISYVVAKYGELPETVEKPLWKQAYEGLLVVSILESISTAGSGGFLLIFFFVNIAALKLRDKVKINPILPLIGVFLTFIAFLILMFRMAA